MKIPVPKSSAFSRNLADKFKMLKFSKGHITSKSHQKMATMAYIQSKTVCQRIKKEVKYKSATIYTKGAYNTVNISICVDNFLSTNPTILILSSFSK